MDGDGSDEKTKAAERAMRTQIGILCRATLGDIAAVGVALGAPNERIAAFQMTAVIGMLASCEMFARHTGQLDLFESALAAGRKGAREAVERSELDRIFAAAGPIKGSA